MKLPDLCLNKVFLTMISASFFFSFLLFNIAVAGIDANAEEIRIVHEDIKQILSDTAFIKGQLTK